MRIAMLSVLLVFAWPWVCSAASSLAYDEGVAYVVNDGIPTQGIRSIDLSDEAWRTDVDREPLFRNIKKILFDSDIEEYYVLDNRSGIIHVFSEKGRLLRSLHVKGEGPGKVFAVSDFQLLPDDRIGLLSPLGPKLVSITRRGDPIYDSVSEIEFYSDRQSVSNCYHFESVGDSYVLSGEQGYRGSAFITVCNDGGYREVDLLDLACGARLGERTFDDHDDYLLAYKPWTVTHGGVVFYSPRRTGSDRYSLVACNLEGVESLVASQPYEGRKRTSREVEAVKAALFGGTGGYEEFIYSGWKVIIPERAPDVIGITEHQDRLWVETSRTRGRTSWTYDVFDMEGEYIERVIITCMDSNGFKDDIYIFDSTIVVVKGRFDAVTAGFDPEQDDLQIICYDRNDRIGTELDGKRCQ